MIKVPFDEKVKVEMGSGWMSWEAGEVAQDKQTPKIRVSLAPAGSPPRWRLSTEAVDGNTRQTSNNDEGITRYCRPQNSFSTFPLCPKGPESQRWCFRVIVSHPRCPSRRLASQSAAGRLTGQAPHLEGPCPPMPPSSADRRKQHLNHRWKKNRRFKKQAPFNCHLKDNPSSDGGGFSA